MEQPHHEPLGLIDGNRKSEGNKDAGGLLDPLSNANSKPAPAFTNESQQHQSLHNKLLRQERTGQQQGQYISPSDNILSPASQKLNAFKEKRFTKQAKPRALFSTTKPLNFDGMSESTSPAEASQAQFGADSQGNRQGGGNPSSV